MAIARAVDQVLAGLALPDEASSTKHALFALSAESMPDLASRVRQKLTATGLGPVESGTATSGRFTVVTIRARGELRSQLEGVAHDLHALLSVIDDAAIGTPSS